MPKLSIDLRLEKSCVVSIPEDSQKPSEHCPGRLAISGSACRQFARWPSEDPFNANHFVNFKMQVQFLKTV